MVNICCLCMVFSPAQEKHPLLPSPIVTTPGLPDQAAVLTEKLAAVKDGGDLLAAQNKVQTHDVQILKVLTASLVYTKNIYIYSMIRKQPCDVQIKTNFVHMPLPTSNFLGGDESCAPWI